jgi:hypothetical protein
MPNIKVRLTTAEIQALLKMGRDQIFCVKFLDSRIPGYEACPVKEVHAAAAALAVLETALELKPNRVISAEFTNPYRASRVPWRGNG